MSFAQLRHCALEQAVESACSDLDFYGVEHTVEQVREIATHNISYIHQHGLSRGAFERYFAVKAMLEQWYAEREKCPMAGDILTLRAKNGKTYEGARLCKEYGTLAVCTQPYTPFIEYRHPPHPVLGASMSVSGGYFQSIETEPLTLVGEDTVLFKFWGSTPCANGALNIEAKVLRWELESENFY